MSANRHAMLRGAEQVWCKAEAYVNAEPYRSILARTLAQQRLFMALADVETRRAEARKLLELARTGHPDHIPRWAYFAARAMIEIPGARELLMRHWFGPIRSALRRPLGFPIDRFRSAPD
jgi:hypothetical protein